METLSGIVVMAYVGLSGVVGVRLLRLASRTAARRSPSGDALRPPELWLGLFFLLYSCAAALMNCAVYAGWSNPALALPDLASRLLHAGFLWIGGVGLVGLLRFIQQTFRSNAVWATRLVGFFVATLLGSTVMVGLTEGYEVRVVNGVGYWIQFAARDAIFIWFAIEAFRYWRLLRRRMRLGLAEAMLTNRFFLMGLWATALAVLAHADTVARVLYYLETGSTTEWVPEIGKPLLLIGMSSATGFLALGSAAVWLAFFPTARYRRWIDQRARAARATS